MFILTIAMIMIAACILIISVIRNATIINTRIDAASQRAFTMPSVEYSNYTSVDWDNVWGGRYAE